MNGKAVFKSIRAVKTGQHLSTREQQEGIGPVGTLQLLQKILSSVMDLMQCITER